ncbi:MAG: BlaI/MecI/CopY family transcriptional regulator [Oscillospiraceae bacterium]|nr:BlaI/MecI/CopY family transcriptional regulator [Oscillospiraceae bacterium]
MKELAAKISSSELDVLEVLWQAEGPLPIADIRSALEQSHSWDSSTVKTLLRRLCEKKAVEVEKREVFYYRPLLSRREYQVWSTRSLIDKVYRGSARSLVASLVERSQLSREDLAELRSILYPEEEWGHD